MAPELSETLLIEAVRRYSSGLAEQEAGWLKGLKDPYIGRALALIHQKLSAAWSAEALASEVALSRSAFAVQRFTSLVSGCRRSGTSLFGAFRPPS